MAGRSYLYVTGIAGDSTEPAHLGWFDAESISFEGDPNLGPRGGGKRPESKHPCRRWLRNREHRVIEVNGRPVRRGEMQWRM